MEMVVVVFVLRKLIQFLLQFAEMELSRVRKNVMMVTVPMVMDVVQNVPWNHDLFVQVDLFGEIVRAEVRVA